MGRALRILYVADMTPGWTAAMRFHALQSLGHEVRAITITSPKSQRMDRAFAYRVLRKLWRPVDWAGANRAIVQSAAHEDWDVLWIDRGLTIQAKTFRAVKRLQPSCVIVGYSLDDMFARHNQTPQFLEQLPLYDVFFTNKTYGVAELKSLGCPRVEFTGNAYDPATHRPLQLTDEERRHFGSAVGFIGAYERERAASMSFLARNEIPVKIWGSGWQRHATNHANLLIQYRAPYGDGYAKVLNATGINLCFLRKINRDLQTTRSIEIPACGAFMLAERTVEHEQLFVEGEEAEFFSNDDELLEKVRYYLQHPQERIQIAAAGLRRCITSGYSYAARLAEILARI